MNQRASDKKLHRIIRNTVILTLLGAIPILWGMGLLPWATAESLDKQHNEIDQLNVRVEVGFARIETKQEAIHDDISEIKNILKNP